VTYLIPVVAFFWGLLDNEMLTPIQFFGAFVILVGVYLSAKNRAYFSIVFYYLSIIENGYICTIF